MFRFKQFTVADEGCAMKVGTDGVLLGAWCDVTGVRRVLDVGTGTGLISLMIAQRTSIFSNSAALITALDIDNDAVSQAIDNVSNSPWKDRIVVLEQDFRFFASEKRFDLIVCNPPFFVNSLVCPGKQRAIARHTCSLGYGDLLEGVARKLSDDGRFCLVIPMEVSDWVKGLAAGWGLHVSKQLIVFTTPGKPAKRTLIEFGFNVGAKCVTKELLVEVSRHCYSAEYIELTRDFYLKF